MGWGLILLVGGSISNRWRGRHIRAPHWFSECRGRSRNNDFKGRPCGCWRRCREALYLVDSCRLLRATCLSFLLLIGGGFLGNPASIAEERRVELVGLVAHYVHILHARFLPFGCSCSRLCHLRLLLGLQGTGGGQEGVVADGWWSSDVGRVLPGGREGRCR